MDLDRSLRQRQRDLRVPSWCMVMVVMMVWCALDMVMMMDCLAGPSLGQTV